MLRKLLTTAPLAILLVGAAARADVTFFDQPAEGEFAVQCTLALNAGDARILFSWLDADNTYVAQIRDGKAELLKVLRGKEHRLAGPSPLPDEVGATATIAVLRRDWQIALLCDGKTLCRAYDDEFHGGKAGYDGQGIQEPLLQPLAGVYAMDDFVRPGAGAAGWTTLTGTWENQALEPDGLVAEWNANPFAFLSRTPQNALAAYGNWFWDDYRAGVSAKGPAGGSVGLCVRLENPDNFLLFRWAASDTPDADARGKQLVEVVNGQWNVVGESPGGYVPELWHRLELTVFGDRLEAYADRQLVMTYEPVAFGAGRVALYASGGQQAFFDDFLVESAHALTDAFAESSAELPSRGPKWAPSGAKVNARPNGVWLSAREGPGVANGGPPQWGDFRFRAETRVEDAGGIGVVFARRGPGEGYLLRWGGAGRTQYQGKLQLIRYVGGEPTVLAQAAGPHAVNRWQPFEFTVRGGHVIAQAGDGERLECFDPALADGAVALFADRTRSVCFRHIDVRSLQDEFSEPRITEQFTKEATMSGWASPEGAWVEVPSPTGGHLWWNKGTFYADPAVEFALPAAGSATGAAVGIICADGPSPDSGYALHVAMQSGSPTLRLELARLHEVLDRAEVQAQEGAAPRISIAKRGLYVIASVDGKPALFRRDDFPLAGRSVGLACDGTTIDLAAAQATSPNMVDYTFSDAPVDWFPARGDWRIMNRWPCKKGWAWYGGVGDKVPVLWSKQAFAGDMTLEFYGAILMDQPSAPGYSHPGDLNCAICADGRRLDSGYAFIYAGWGNQKGAILRRGELVGQNTDAHFDNPVSSNLAFQRHWFYVRVEKQGNRIRYSVDDKPVASYEDPDPISAGRVAFWTWNNGILIARARISYQSLAPAQPLTARLPSNPTDLPYALYSAQ